MAPATTYDMALAYKDENLLGKRLLYPTNDGRLTINDYFIRLSHVLHFLHAEKESEIVLIAKSFFDGFRFPPKQNFVYGKTRNLY